MEMGLCWEKARLKNKCDEGAYWKDNCIQESAIELREVHVLLFGRQSIWEMIARVY